MPTALSVDVLVPEFAFRVSNPREVITAMARLELTRVRTRARNGQGARGPLPRGKKGGSPWQDTGQLIDSLDVQIREPRGRGLPWALVLPTGLRREAADVAQRRAARSSARRRAKAAELRAARRAGTLGLGEEGIRRRAGRAAAEARRLGRRGVRVGSFRAMLRRAERKGRYGLSDKDIRAQARAAGKLGYRQARRNMDVAAILMNKPKDARARAGNRGTYYVLGANAADWRAMQKVAAKLARFELVEKRSGVAHRGRGVAA